MQRLPRPARVELHDADQDRSAGAGAVVGEQAHAELGHLPQRRQLLAGPAHGDGPGHVDVAHRLGPELEDLAHHAGVVDGRFGVGHRHHRRVPAEGRGAGAGLHRLRFLPARLAQVRVEVDEARKGDEPIGVDHLGAVGGQALSYPGDDAAVDQQSAIIDEAVAAAHIVEREQRVELKVPISLPAGRMIHDVAGVFMRFPKWTGAPFVDDFGRKSAAMIDLDGEHLFPELAVLRVLEKDGWNGRWVSTYSAGKEVWKYLTEWKDVPREEQRTRPLEDAEPSGAAAPSITELRSLRFSGLEFVVLVDPRKPNAYQVVAATFSNRRWRIAGPLRVGAPLAAALKGIDVAGVEGAAHRHR